MKKKENNTEEQVEKKNTKEVIKQFVKDIVKPAHMIVDFGSSNIKVIYGNFSRKNIEIYGHNIMPSTKELLNDGKILNPLEVATLLRNSIKENKVNVKNLTLILSGSDVIIREIQIPKAEDREIGKIIEFEAQQYFPIELTQYMTDYKVLEEVTDGEEEKLRILLVAVPIEQIQDYVQVAEFLGVELECVDLIINTSLKYLLGNNYLKDFAIEKEVSMEGMSLQGILNLDISSAKIAISNFIKERKKNKQDTEGQDNEQQNEEEQKEPSKLQIQLSKIKDSLKNLKDTLMKKLDKIIKKAQKEKPADTKPKQVIDTINENNFVLLDMGAKTTSIYIYSNHRLKFTRTLLEGGNELDKRIAQDLTMSEQDAELLKINKGNIIIEGKDEMLYDEVQGLNKAITTAFNSIMDDAGRFLEFYNSRSENGNIEKIYIYGGASKLRGVKEYMSNFFNIPVEYLERGHYNVSYTGEKKEDYELNKRSLVNAVGGLIR